MDFVIFGIGTGAALVLIGWLGRDLGPRLRDRAPSDPDAVLSVEELVARVSWARFCGSGGAALALCGAVLLLVTVATLLLRVSDETGTTTMLATFGVVLVAMTVWSWAYVRRFGVYGVVRRRPRVEPEPEAPRPIRQPAVEIVPSGIAAAAASAAITPESHATAEPEVAAGADVAPDTPLVAEPDLAKPAVSADASTDVSGPDSAAEPVSAEPPEVDADSPALPADHAEQPMRVTAEVDGPTPPLEPGESANRDTPIDATANEPAADATAEVARDEEMTRPTNGTVRPDAEALPAPAESDPPSAEAADAASSEGLVDEAPVSRRAARRRARAERRDYLARGQPKSATEPGERPAKPADGTRSEGET